MRRALRPYQRRYDPPAPAGLGRREETRRRAGPRLLLEEEPRPRAEERFVPALTAGFVTVTAWCVAGGFAIAAIVLLTGRAAGGAAGTQTRSV